MPKTKVIPSTATLVTLAILASSHARPSRAQQVNCLSLESSTACPAFQSYYVGLAGLATRYPYLANVTDISSFDSSLKAYALSSSDYLDALGCAGYANDSSTPYARYSLSRLCAGLIQDTDSSLPCNYQNNVTPPPLCQTTCDDWLASVTQITSESSKCPNSSQRYTGMVNLATQCANWQGYNGTTSENCIMGTDNEPENCGFQDDLTMACRYCSNNGTDSCCSNVSCHRLSAAAIAGIVIGCLVGAASIAFAAFFFCARRKRVRNDNFKFTTYVPPRDDYYQTDRLFNRAANSSRGSLVSNHQRNLSTSTTAPPQPTPPPPPPPLLTTALNDATPEDDQSASIRQEPDIPESLQPKPEDLYMAVHPYPPQMGDELALHVGDIICLAVRFDDGWALGFNVMTGHKGAFPTVCVAPVPQDVLEDMLADGSSKALVEDEQSEQQSNPVWQAPAETPSYHGSRAPTPPRLNLDHIRESLRRSVTLPHHKSPALTHHSNIPKRTASIRTTYGYSEADSPTSPTLNTPFFDVTPLSNAVVRSPRNLERRKHHQLQDEIELH